MIDIDRLKKMLGALPFALDANLPDDARAEIRTAFAELIECRQRIAAVVAECERLERASGAEQCQTELPFRVAARRIRAKLEGR